jgi:hypothetical protein
MRSRIKFDIDNAIQKDSVQTVIAAKGDGSSVGAFKVTPKLSPKRIKKN